MEKQSGCAAITLVSKVPGLFAVVGLVAGVLLTNLLSINPVFANAPTAPGQVSVTASGGSGLVITWANSVDADGVVVGYELVKNGTAQWLGNVTWYRDTAVSQGITYAYSIVAIDNEGWRSAVSDTVTFRFSQSAQQGSDTSSGGSISVAGAIEQSGQCVDTDGDGWGWDGQKSCKVKTSASSSASASSGTCIDEDGDGYGWDGFRTCLINESAACVDTDGDGYGWDGQQTCIP